MQAGHLILMIDDQRLGLSVPKIKPDLLAIKETISCVPI